MVFMQDFNLNETNGNLTPINQGVFKIRFSPDEIGTWNYTIRVDSKYGSDQLAPASFTCTDSANKGFIRVSPANYLHYDDGSQYIPIGYNVAWHNNNPVFNYTTWLSKLSAVGGNFYRLWMPHWGLGMEWRNGNGYSGLRKYKETNMAYLDWLVEYSEEKIWVLCCVFSIMDKYQPMLIPTGANLRIMSPMVDLVPRQQTFYQSNSKNHTKTD